jgi:hypothetical protein
MKVMFDECMGTKASRLLVEAFKLHKPPIESQFLEDYLHQKGTWDLDWSKLLADEGGWCVVTTDYQTPRGAKARLKGPPLHIILPARGITGFFLAGKIAQRTGFEKARVVFYVFPELWQRAQTAANGTRFRIVSTGNGYKMSEWPCKASLPILP